MVAKITPYFSFFFAKIAEYPNKIVYLAYKSLKNKEI